MRKRRKMWKKTGSMGKEEGERGEEGEGEGRRVEDERVHGWYRTRGKEFSI